MQVQKMAELSDGQKSRVVFAKLGRDAPHILLLVSIALFYRSSPLKSNADNKISHLKLPINTAVGVSYIVSLM
jgi:ABC-type glutathione transport system ATPase component